MNLVLSESLQSYLSESFASDDFIILDATIQGTESDALISRLSHLDSALRQIQASLSTEGQLMTSDLLEALELLETPESKEAVREALAVFSKLDLSIINLN